MDFTVDAKNAYAYTAAHDLDPAKPAIVFVHGAGLDHSWWGLQSRYFGYHGWNVLACDLPGHGREAHYGRVYFEHRKPVCGTHKRGG